MSMTMEDDIKVSDRQTRLDELAQFSNSLICQVHVKPSWIKRTTNPAPVIAELWV